MIRRPLILAVTAALLAAAPASAEELKPFTPPTLGPLTPVPGAAPIKDRVLTGSGDQAAKVVRKDAAAPAVYPDGDGHFVSIAVSDLYAPDPVRDQAMATFLGTLEHGAEMSKLHVVIMKPLEIITACGEALACYMGATQTMLVSGDGDEFGQAPNTFVIAHEYGHHLARNNINPPFTGSGGAVPTGPKYWASLAGVCPGLGTGYFSISPAADYYRFPGEVFAETFAQKQFPGIVAWEFDTLPPTAGQFQAIDKDVFTPWTGPTVQKLTGKFKRSGGSVSSKVFTTPLDGDVAVSLRGPKNAKLELQLLSADGLLGYDREGGKSRSKRVSGVVCGESSLQARVIRKSGQGKYKLTISKP